MLFNSLEFCIFFPLVVIFHYFIWKKFRWQFLLLTSCYFYAAFVPLYLVLVFSIIGNAFITGLLFKSNLPRKLVMIIGVFVNISILILFKYYTFLHENLDILFGLLNTGFFLPELKLILPIGLSFHVFQAISYIIEVYYHRQETEHHFGYFSLYIMYFPQLIAGPIERPQNTLPQFKLPYSINSEKVISGLLILFWGLFKKVVIADRLAMAVDFSFENFSQQSGLSLAIAAFFYSFQIYCDFSGYSDIAIGASRILGIELMKNFKSPYIAKSITEFWKRWHISLSTWFRDYLYIPLGGNKVSSNKLYINLMIVFVVSGIWHGANWTFIVWGAIHGIILIIEKMINSVSKSKSNNAFKNSSLKKIMGQIITFTVVTIAWIYFRAPRIEVANDIIFKIFSVNVYDNIDLKLGNIELIFSFALIVILMIIEFEKLPKLRSQGLSIMLVTLLAISCYFFGVFNSQQFIYFQF